MKEFLLALFSRTNKACQVCEVYKQQLEIANNVNAELINTITNLYRPQVHVAADSATTNQKSSFTGVKTWSRRRKELEEAERQAAKVEANSVHLKEPDIFKKRELIQTVTGATTAELEEELGISDKELM